VGLGRIFARILLNLPEKNLNKSRVTSKNKLFCVILGAVGHNCCSYFHVFAQTSRDFVKIFRDFAQISTGFKGFGRIFTK